MTRNSTEADGNVEYVSDGPSAISLRIAAAASPVRLEEHKVLCRHHSGRWIQPQRGDDVVPELVRRRIAVAGRVSFGKVREQYVVAVRVTVTVGERQVTTIYLQKTYTV